VALITAAAESRFQDHNDGKRCRIVAAETDGVVVGSASSGRDRAKAAYETTVETSIACHPAATGRGIGTLLYQVLFAELAALITAERNFRVELEKLQAHFLDERLESRAPAQRIQ
jgi:L-amino acid N-acyltransferase YncA